MKKQYPVICLPELRADDTTVESLGIRTPEEAIYQTSDKYIHKGKGHRFPSLS